MIANGESFALVFYVFSGFLLCILAYPVLQKGALNKWKFMIRTTAFRYLRMAPLLMLFVMLHASWMHHFGSGPFWDKVNYSERNFCRRNWWMNLLFINNYFSGDEKVLWALIS